ncbi:MAG: ATP-binding cassette domain-containing protein [Clostridiales Family XIII bacterium]|nr:ATP-binding cassette domain-containing protein [Clostridiales Family XIII bacterium]
MREVKCPDPVLRVENLRVSFPKSKFVLHEISFDLRPGEILAVIGESGSGKSTFLKAVTRLSDADAEVSGEVLLNGVSLSKEKEESLRRRRFVDYSVVFQNSGEYLNPMLTLGEMLTEVLRKKHGRQESESMAAALMESVGLSVEDLGKRPSKISGGMVQRFQIAAAMALSPSLVVLDEPTSSQDYAARGELIRLIRSIRKSRLTAFILVTHDLALARELSRRLIVLYEGSVCETGPTEDVLHRPRHPYTRALVHSSMDLHPYRDVWGIRAPSGVLPPGACPFFGRCTQSLPLCACVKPKLGAVESASEPAPGGFMRHVACNRGGVVRILECTGLKKSFEGKEVIRCGKIFVNSGEIVSIVGKSGSGKTTLCRMLSGFLERDGGEILYDGAAVDFDATYRKVGGMQFVMQDHENSLNPHLTVHQAVREPLFLIRRANRQADGARGEDAHCEAEVRKALREVGLADEDFPRRRINTLSGGQKQRVALARCLVTKPALLIADEPTSMLDCSGKANLARMLKGIQNSAGFSMLMVTHDIFCALKMSDRIYLLRDGVLEEVAADADFEWFERAI